MKPNLWVAIACILTGVPGVQAQDQPASAPATFPKPKPNSADEPMAAKLTLAKAAEFLDNVSVSWTRERKCGTCHTNYPYLMARPALEKNTPGEQEVRRFFESRVARWDSGEKADKPRWDTEVVATAVALAVNDAHTTGKLHPATRQALDRMWTLQQKDGAWNWIKCDWPPMEHDDYFGAVYVALGVGLAPDRYAETDAARAGLARLRHYFKHHPAPNLHHQAWLMWASLKLDGLMTREEREALAGETVPQLLARQREDGGWSLGALGQWKGSDGRKSSPDAPSDSYATAFTVFILRQAGVPAADPRIQKGIAWLKTHQRQSGRWFTPSPNTDNHHFLSHAATAFAVMALKACGEGE